ncbi:hypothetical protein DH2020_036842 [Rehmannia glutinosa]|uniref:RING-type E3 ubiquitin transferase n=1 Tax=Rehmannia glutinosa TaxID=99300 RepID=A0ABR0V300_REHGL
MGISWSKRHNRHHHHQPPPPHHPPLPPSSSSSSVNHPPPPQITLPPTTPQPTSPPHDHQSAKKIKNDVNVHKDTIRLQLDEQYPDCHLVSFTFDALVDGSQEIGVGVLTSPVYQVDNDEFVCITILYFAKEGEYCRFTPVYPEIVPVKIPFHKGLGQKFCQPSGTGVDLGFFDTDDLSKPVPGDDVYPLVISAESCVPSVPTSEHSNEELLNSSHHAQISQAVLEKKDGRNFQVKVIKQILWIDGSRYELREIFGISDSDEANVSNVESGKECIICLTEVKNTAVLPCRHMCMCSDCAKELRLQSNKCPVCRQPIEELLEIKVDEGRSWGLAVKCSMPWYKINQQLLYECQSHPNCSLGK